jgi:hypothetical protein
VDIELFSPYQKTDIFCANINIQAEGFPPVHFFNVFTVDDKAYGMTGNGDICVTPTACKLGNKPVSGPTPA